MASGTRKRQYQPSLTSYFPTLSERRSSGNALSPVSPTSHQTYAPIVPAAVQSSLLNVGMRVRKAVPEGYKTKAATLTSETYATAGYDQAKRTRQAPFQFEVEKENQASHTFQPDGSGRANELLPFCGVHKVGGWGVQDSFATSSPLPALTFEDSTPFSSQESNMSNFSTDSMPATLHKLQTPTAAMHSKKRQLDNYEDHYGTDVEALVDKDYPVFTIFTEEEEEDSTMLDRRRIAQPVTRRKTMALPTRHQNMPRAEHVGGGPDDFGEASFLQPHDHMEGIVDSEMGIDDW